jgi:hypothetical protein
MHSLRVLRGRLPLVLVCLTTALGPSTARAQTPPPVGPFAIDVRLALPRFDQDAAIASALGVASASLPQLGLGLDVGAHWYPLSLGPVRLGVGASMLVGRARSTPVDASAGQSTDFPIESRLITFAPQVSLNFGTGRGWSYLSGGLGPSIYDVRPQGTPVDNSRRTRTLNYGGGARWFAKPHLAFTFDLRFYVLDAQEATDTLVATPKTTRMVFGAGISIK